VTVVPIGTTLMAGAACDVGAHSLLGLEASDGRDIALKRATPTHHRGNTLRRPACVHWTGRDACRWLLLQRAAGARIVGVELAEEAVRLADLPAARRRTIAVLGHEQTGIPPEAVELLDVAVEIPMVGSGASLNVAVAGSLVLYRLAGLI